MKKQITIEQAIAIAESDNCSQEDWEAAERTLLNARLCPTCAQDGFREKLGRLQESTADSYAGRECPSCEEFFPDRGQDHHYMDRSPYDTDGAGMCFSDADPGL